MLDLSDGSYSNLRQALTLIYARLLFRSSLFSEEISYRIQPWNCLSILEGTFALSKKFCFNLLAASDPKRAPEASRTGIGYATARGVKARASRVACVPLYMVLFRH